MYLPDGENLAEATCRKLVKKIGAGNFITSCETGWPHSSFLPFLWHENTVFTHTSSKNSQWSKAHIGQRVLVVVTGAHGYVSSHWYAQNPAPMASTWDFSVVQLFCEISEVNSPRAAETVLCQQAEFDPQLATELRGEYTDSRLSQLTVLALDVIDVAGRGKLSQEQSEDDRKAIATYLRQIGNVALAQDIYS